MSDAKKILIFAGLGLGGYLLWKNMQQKEEQRVLMQDPYHVQNFTFLQNEFAKTPDPITHKPSQTFTIQNYNTLQKNLKLLPKIEPIDFKSGLFGFIGKN